MGDSSRIRCMHDYAKMTRAELIARLQALEKPPTSGEAATGQAASMHGLRDTEERLRAILQTAVEGIITIDDHGMVESMNPAAEKVFGFSAGEVVGRNVS